MDATWGVGIPATWGAETATWGASEPPIPSGGSSGGNALGYIGPMPGTPPTDTEDDDAAVLVVLLRRTLRL